MHARRLIVTVLVCCAGHQLAAQSSPNLAPYLMTARAEIALARTAAPRHVSDSATVLVLTAHGYVQAVRGTNGFTCLVARSFESPVGDPGFANASIRAPHCLNAPAVRTVLPEILARAEWFVGGASPAEISARTRRAYASHQFPAPAPGAMAFMLSPEQRLGNEDPHWVPHVMFYFDKSVPASTWGVGGATNTLIDGSVHDPDRAMLTILIPVRCWSDGRSAMP